LLHISKAPQAGALLRLQDVTMLTVFRWTIKKPASSVRQHLGGFYWFYGFLNMVEYIKVFAVFLRVVKTMSLSRLLLLLLVLFLTPVTISLIWKLPEIILALK